MKRHGGIGKKDGDRRGAAVFRKQGWGGAKMSIDDIGARRLIASILQKASEDYANDKGCPEWCSFKDRQRAERFDTIIVTPSSLSIPPGAALCDGLNIDHEEYVTVCIKASAQ